MTFTRTHLTGRRSLFRPFRLALAARAEIALDFVSGSRSLAFGVALETRLTAWVRFSARVWGSRKGIWPEAGRVRVSRAGARVGAVFLGWTLAGGHLFCRISPDLCTAEVKGGRGSLVLPGCSSHDGSSFERGGRDTMSKYVDISNDQSDSTVSSDDAEQAAQAGRRSHTPVPAPVSTVTIAPPSSGTVLARVAIVRIPRRDASCG